MTTQSFHLSTLPLLCDAHRITSPCDGPTLKCFLMNCVFTLRAKLSGAVYCYQSCLWRAGGLHVSVSVFVGLLLR